jgi:N6-adenosine-specific RNA methylase IME4
MELIKWNNAKKAIAECKSIDEVKNIIDKAQAMKAYAKQINESLQVQNDIAEIKLRAERKAGEMLKETSKQKPGEYQRLQDVTVAPSLKDLGIQKHQSSRWQKIANIEEDKFEELINETKQEEKELTESMLLKEAKNIKREKEINNIKEKIKNENIKVKNKYDCVILDPPWYYGNKWDANSMRGVTPYPTQSIDEIYNTCKDFFKKDCVLWLWTTHRFIWDAKELINMWGFEYKACGVWDKGKIGIGKWLRMQCEFFLLAIKGQPLYNNTKYRDIIKEDRREHSREPEFFYNMVKDVCFGEIFEYYSRENRNGINNIGYENGKF